MNFLRKVALLVLMAMGSAHAESPSALQTFGLDLASPWTTDAREPLLYGTGLTAAVFLTRNAFEYKWQKQIAQSKPLGGSAKIGDLGGQLIPNAAYFAGMFAYSWMSGGSVESERRAILMLKATAYSSLVTTAFKYSIREERPGHGSKNSFPSGHATTAFSFASVVAAEHEWYYGVPAYAFAGFVGLSRMNDNKHYLHDVLAGATIGTSYGLGIWHRSREVEPEKHAAEFILLPLDGITLMARTHF